MRDMLFLGHANPEDNEIAFWLALRLASEGYPVWCDLTSLLGGEVFWTDIEAALRERTAKYLLVLSRASNAKPGVRNEVALAQSIQRREGLKDFVIPLWIDDLVSSDFNINLLPINAIRFQEGWHDGLAQLLQKLEQENVPKRTEFNPASVASWWRERMSAAHGVRDEPEMILTNWHMVRPAVLFFYRLRGTLANQPVDFQTAFAYPAERVDDLLVSFAPAADLEPSLGSALSIAESVSRTINGAERRPRLWGYKQERQTLTKLLNQVWQRMLADRQLPTYEFASGPPAFYFTKGMVPLDTIWFDTPGGDRTRRAMVGTRTVGRREEQRSVRYWHYALEARPIVSPVVGYTMKPHVLFSDDGREIWPSKDRLARARRSQCKNWWNADWRDRNLAAVQFLSGGEQTIRLQVGSDTWIEVDRMPLKLTSPVSFDESTLDAAGDAVAIDDQPDDDSDDEEAE